jgi:hypothetical protein
VAGNRRALTREATAVAYRGQASEEADTLAALTWESAAAYLRARPRLICARRCLPEAGLVSDLGELGAPFGQLSALAGGARAHVGGVAAGLSCLDKLPAHGGGGSGRDLGA